MADSDDETTPAWMAAGVAGHAGPDDALANPDRCPTSGGACPGSACGKC